MSVSHVTQLSSLSSAHMLLKTSTSYRVPLGRYITYLHILRPLTQIQSDPMSAQSPLFLHVESAEATTRAHRSTRVLKRIFDAMMIFRVLRE